MRTACVRKQYLSAEDGGLVQRRLSTFRGGGWGLTGCVAGGSQASSFYITLPVFMTSPLFSNADNE
jgi:hypothetical protein